MFFLPSDCAPSLFLIPLAVAVPSFPSQPGSVGRSPGSIRGLGIFVKFALRARYIWQLAAQPPFFAVLCDFDVNLVFLAFF